MWQNTEKSSFIFKISVDTCFQIVL
jgi:hypothetical protein